MFLVGERLSYTYNRRTRVEPVNAIRDVSVRIQRGSFTGVIGPNGCGKTTLLKLLAGVLAPDSGSVELDGHALTSLSRRQAARRIAVVPQETHPAFEYTVLEMALMGRHPHLGPLQLEGPNDLAIAYESLHATGTAHLTERSYMTLSGGEKQRVVVASALTQTPEVLLLDEPTASLDLGFQLEIGLLLRRLNQERSATMVMATHDLNLAASLCDTLVLMRDGRVLASGNTTDVLTSTTVRQLYDVEADVRVHELAGHLTVVPLGRVG
jgi:iron complex transport system ATP-binding protein